MASRKYMTHRMQEERAYRQARYSRAFANPIGWTSFKSLSEMRRAKKKEDDNNEKSRRISERSN